MDQIPKQSLLYCPFQCMPNLLPSIWHWASRLKNDIQLVQQFWLAEEDNINFNFAYRFFALPRIYVCLAVFHHVKLLRASLDTIWFFAGPSNGMELIPVLGFVLYHWPFFCVLLIGERLSVSINSRSHADTQQTVEVMRFRVILMLISISICQKYAPTHANYGRLFKYWNIISYVKNTREFFWWLLYDNFMPNWKRLTETNETISEETSFISA